MDTIIRLAHTNDIGQILTIMEDFYALSEYPFDKTAAEENLKIFLTDENLGRIWLLTNEEQVVGYLILTFGFSFEYRGRDAIIDEFYIVEKLRGLGHGKQMLAFLKQEAIALNIKALHLEVERDNDRAIRLYTNKGFEGNNRNLISLKL
jgi:ribosomal protein S18 acetylase RimI-like enzyme